MLIWFESELMKNLLIIGAGIYGLVAKEIAESMGCYGKISFVDDGAQQTPNGIPVVGTTKDLKVLRDVYDCVVVAIGNPTVRGRLLKEISEAGNYGIETLVSPRAYVAPSAKIAEGCIIEPMAVVHTEVILGMGCLISAGAVVNHAANCDSAVHVDCNAVVPGNVTVPSGTKVKSGSVYAV